MRKLSVSVCIALLLMTYVAKANAAMTQYQIWGQVSGAPAEDKYLGFFEFDINKSYSIIQETLPSGVKHNEYKLSFLGFDYMNPKFGYSIYNDAPGTFMSAYGREGSFTINQYLNLDGSSALSIHGYNFPGCHGGCTFESELNLNYTSTASDLFGNLASPLSFEALSSASGNSIYNYVDYVLSSDLYNKTDFQITSTVSVVPELETWIFLLSGLGFLAFFLNRKGSPSILIERECGKYA